MAAAAATVLLPASSLPTGAQYYSHIPPMAGHNLAAALPAFRRRRVLWLTASGRPLVVSATAAPPAPLPATAPSALPAATSIYIGDGGIIDGGGMELHPPKIHGGDGITGPFPTSGRGFFPTGCRRADPHATDGGGID